MLFTPPAITPSSPGSSSQPTPTFSSALAGRCSYSSDSSGDCPSHSTDLSPSVHAWEMSHAGWTTDDGGTPPSFPAAAMHAALMTAALANYDI